MRRVVCVVIIELFSGAVACRGDVIDLSTLPTQIDGVIVPVLVVRTVEKNDHKGLAVMAMLRGTGGTRDVFNPFGDWNAGRAYRIVLADKDCSQVLHTVVPAVTEHRPLNGRTHWFHMYQGGLVGRVHWTASVAEDDCPAHDLANLPHLPAGRYALVMLVSQRMVPQGMFRHNLNPEVWLDPELDVPRYASRPVFVDVDDQGEYRLIPDKDETFQPFEVDVRRVPTNPRNSHLLHVWVRFVAQTDDWLMLPGLNLFASLTDRSTKVLIRREDGDPFERFSGFHSSKSPYGEMLHEHAVLVPRDGIVGGTLTPATDQLPPGRYAVSATIDESLYQSKLFDGAKRVQQTWPIVHRTPEVIVEIPE